LQTRVNALMWNRRCADGVSSCCGIITTNKNAEPPREVTMRYKPKSVGALQVALAGLPASMRVEVDPETGVHARTVGDLRKLADWPGNLAVATPHEPHPGDSVRVTHASHATRVTPKP
jgi:hypothetical protein